MPFSSGSPNPGTEPWFPALQADFLPSEPPGKPLLTSLNPEKEDCYKQQYLQNPSSASTKGFPAGLDGKQPACNAGDLGAIPGSGRFPREGNGSPLQYSCQENFMDKGTWRATVHGITKSPK